MTRPRRSPPSGATGGPPTVRARRLGFYTQDDAVVLMRADCHVCRSEGLAPRSQVLLEAHGRQVLATLYQLGEGLLQVDEAGLSEAAWAHLGVEAGDLIVVRHPPALASMSSVRRRIHSQRLDGAAMKAIITDVAAARYTDVHLSAFLTACSALPLDAAETIHLTRAMVEAGDRLSWDRPLIIDKHCVGGLPGNRTTPIIVAIVACHGLWMPKTSSRAITSPAGTADTMETLAPVDLDLATMRAVVKAQGGCIAWGGAVRLSPADDILIRVERVLDIDTEGQLIASVLSKKIAAGSTHVVVDIPVGATAKVRSDDAAVALAAKLAATAAAFGVTIRAVLTDGGQPVGRGVGPALEARDVLSVLRGEARAPQDLAERALGLAGQVLELGNAAAAGQGLALATAVLRDGRAWRKFQEICEAQGGMREPPVAAFTREVVAPRSGCVVAIDNRRLSRIAKLAGAPKTSSAGIDLHVQAGEFVERGEALYTLHATSPGTLAYAVEYAMSQAETIHVI